MVASPGISYQYMVASPGISYQYSVVNERVPTTLRKGLLLAEKPRQH
jgi:hypothetical protein